MLLIIQNPVIVNRNADFFYKTNIFESIRDSIAVSQGKRLGLQYALKLSFNELRFTLPLTAQMQDQKHRAQSESKFLY